MQPWFTRLWEYLRRLFVGDNEENGPGTGGDRPPPSEETGRQLQMFFLELLKGDNLQQYRRGRNSYINERRGGLNDDAHRLLTSGDLKEIEEHIAEVTGSGQAVVLFVVCPPL